MSNTNNNSNMSNMKKITVYNLNPQTTAQRTREQILSLVDRFLIMNDIALPEGEIFAAYEQRPGGLMIRLSTATKVIARFTIDKR